ncbi:DUF6531 domain-containing protein [Pseudomonas mangiferae]|nr:DUF6531 domain-containing protein [Pseudomonas mangiferae]
MDYRVDWDNSIFRGGDGCEIGLSYNTATGECEDPKVPSSDGGKGDPNLSCNAPPSFQGNPINTANGNKFQHEVDYVGKNTAAGLVFERYYNGVDGVWLHGYSTRLVISPTQVVLIHADGRQSRYQLVTADRFDSKDETGSLVKQGDQWLYSAPGKTYVFNASGQLERAGEGEEAVSFSYLGGKVIVKNQYGKELTITEDWWHQPRSVSIDDKEFTFTYDLYNRLAQVARIVTNVPSQKTYHYEDPIHYLALTGITDERGVRYATWAYDEQGRAISSEHAGGAEKVTLAYNADGSTTVTNEYGKQATYRFQVIQGVKRIIAIEGEPSPNCPSSNSTFTYDERGLLKTRRDNKGNLTTYDYDARGLEVSRTEAAGTPQARTVTTQWHPTLYRPLQVDEPGRVTRYRYDAQGRETGRTVTEH